MQLRLRIGTVISTPALFEVERPIKIISSPFGLEVLQTSDLGPDGSLIIHIIMAGAE
jgi:hypothetical protein